MILTGHDLASVVMAALNPVPLKTDPISIDIHIAKKLEIEPGGFDTAPAREEFDMPTDIAALLTGRSIHMRRGINTPMGWIDPGKRGEVELEFFNMSDEMQTLDKHEAVARLVFFQVGNTEGYDGRFQE